jgi:hypothetical protein
MKIDDAFQTITHFFNDIIGALVPGAVFGMGLIIMHKGIPSAEEIKLATSNGFLISLMIAATFAVGHGLAAVYSSVIERILKKVRLIESNETSNFVQNQNSYLLFQNFVREKVSANPLLKSCKTSDWDARELRNFAMSVSSEAATITRRFTFISLLYNGVSTALILLAIDLIACTLAAPQYLAMYRMSWPISIQILALIGTAAACVRHGNQFHKRAWTTPFCIAIANLLIQEVKDEHQA